MKLDPARLAGPLIALALLALVAQQTLGALRASGVWYRHRAVAAAPSPYSGLERQIAARSGMRPDSVRRDPFSFGRAEVVAPARRPAALRTAPAAAVASPRLTSIVWLESNPSATIRWNGQDYTVQVNSLFDEFRVRSIARDQVILEHGAETLVLQLPRKGD